MHTGIERRRTESNLQLDFNTDIYIHIVQIVHIYTQLRDTERTTPAIAAATHCTAAATPPSPVARIQGVSKHVSCAQCVEWYDTLQKHQSNARSHP